MVSLGKDIDLTESTVKRRLKQAWLDLLAVNLEWLRLHPSTSSRRSTRSIEIPSTPASSDS